MFKGVFAALITSYFDISICSFHMYSLKISMSALGIAWRSLSLLSRFRTHPSGLRILFCISKSKWTSSRLSPRPRYEIRWTRRLPLCVIAHNLCPSGHITILGRNTEVRTRNNAFINMPDYQLGCVASIIRQFNHNVSTLCICTNKTPSFAWIIASLRSA